MIGISLVTELDVLLLAFKALGIGDEVIVLLNTLIVTTLDTVYAVEKT